MEETEPDLEGGGVLRIYDYREDHWDEIEEEEKEHRGNFHALRREVYIISKG